MPGLPLLFIGHNSYYGLSLSVLILDFADIILIDSINQTHYYSSNK